MNKLKPTIEDVAREAGVSRATASRVINNAPGASGLLRSRVHAAVAALGYQPNESARALASGRKRAVDLVALSYEPSIERLGADPYYSRVLAGMVSALEGVDAQLRVHAGRQADGPDLLDRVADDVTAGAVLINVPPALAAGFHQRCARTVSLGATAPAVPAVEADNIGGAYAAVRQLYDLGRRRIAAIHGPEANTCAIDRRIGHAQAVRDLGLADLSARGGFVRSGGHRAAGELLARHPDIDAMFVACDLMAAGAIQAITASGRRVPEDVSVVGFDDSLVAICTNPPLSTMHLPVEQMAAAATRALLGGAVVPGYRERFPVELVTRESTGHPSTV
ncbi:LacI family DNA-binding transcriptional regulator [Micromonospora zhanjiangensis]|uniref:LacI family DNA-binding transcriptional regulator n=1 Tax=Micromonospora zhanjiangensis TaxID=1522057 RepID=A0ABV8KP45_9ACTN